MLNVQKHLLFRSLPTTQHESSPSCCDLTPIARLLSNVSRKWGGSSERNSCAAYLRTKNIKKQRTVFLCRIFSSFWRMRITKVSCRSTFFQTKPRLQFVLSRTAGPPGSKSPRSLEDPGRNSYFLRFLRSALGAKSFGHSQNGIWSSQESSCATPRRVMCKGRLILRMLTFWNQKKHSKWLSRSKRLFCSCFPLSFPASQPTWYLWQGSLLLVQMGCLARQKVASITSKHNVANNP